MINAMTTVLVTHKITPVTLRRHYFRAIVCVCACKLSFKEITSYILSQVINA